MLQSILTGTTVEEEIIPSLLCTNCPYFYRLIINSLMLNDLRWRRQCSHTETYIIIERREVKEDYLKDNVPNLLYYRYFTDGIMNSGRLRQWFLYWSNKRVDVFIFRSRVCYGINSTWQPTQCIVVFQFYWCQS